MNEQIMRILPVELPYENIRENEDLELHFALGYNCSIKDCASAIEKANLVRCPSEVQIRDIIRKAFDLDALVSNEELMDNFSNTIWEMFVAEEEATKAILALLRGAEMSERLSERERIRAILLNKTPLEAADWHLAEVKRIIDNKESVLTIHILRNWDREKIETFAKHLLGDNAQGGE